MTTTPTENDPLMDLVAKLDPVRQHATAPTANDKNALFERIVGVGEQPAPSRLAYRSGDSRSRRGGRFLPGAIAAALVMLAGTLLFGLFRAPSAEAALVAAAERTAIFDSGRVEVVVELREPMELGGGEFALGYSFDDDNYRLDILFEGVPVVSELRVDGTIYAGDAFPRMDDLTAYSVQLAPPGSFDQESPQELQAFDPSYADSSASRLPPSVVGASRFGAAQFTIDNTPMQWSTNSESAFQSDFLPGISEANARPESVLHLVQLADDYDVTTTANRDLYSGTISRADLLAQDGLPAGVAIVTTGADPAAELPETVRLEVLVVDDLIRQLVLLVEGPNASGEFSSATVTTTYSAYGEDQNLVAPGVISPATATIPSVEALPMPVALPPWAPSPALSTPQEVTIAEVLGRRPGLCFDAGVPENPQPGQRVTARDILAAAAECFLAAGEPGAAEAINQMSPDL